MLDTNKLVKDFEEHLRRHPEHEYRGKSELSEANIIIGRILTKKAPYEDYEK